jgi:hypothetical protein
MNRWLAVIGICSAMAFALPAAAQERQPIGSVKTVSGPAYVVGSKGRVAAGIGDYVYKNDAIETGPQGTLGVIFKDETQVSIGADSQLTLDDFVYQPQTEQYKFATKLARGTLFMATGAIAKLKPDAVQVATPGGTLGVRGTRFVVQVEAP